MTTVSTSRFAMASANSGSFWMAWSRAVCASSTLPRCSSQTAWETSEMMDDVETACASSSYT